jgi:hypothetical protein
MSDDPNAQGTQPGPSWTPPPPQQDYQSYQPVPAPDPIGDGSQPLRRPGPTISINPDIVSPEVVLGLLSLVGVVLGLILKVVDKENTGRADARGKVQLWDTMGWTWAWLAIAAAAVILLVPLLKGALKLSDHVARTVASVAAGALVFWWVLFILPFIGLTTAFLATVGAAAGVGAVWFSRNKAAATS